MPKKIIYAIYDSGVIEYYAKRAVEYEKLYQRPERQSDLLKLEKLFQDTLQDEHVLEIACGTGFWTQKIADVVKSATAIDINEETLEIARHKKLNPNKVKFSIGDAYHLENMNANFTAGFAMHWWSHIPKNKIREFLEQFHQALGKNAQVVFSDNIFVEGSNTPIHRTDEDGNTYQLRPLKDGNSHEVIKNFPSENELIQLVEPYSKEILFKKLDFFWFLKYRLK